MTFRRAPRIHSVYIPIGVSGVVVSVSVTVLLHVVVVEVVVVIVLSTAAVAVNNDLEHGSPLNLLNLFDGVEHRLAARLRKSNVEHTGNRRQDAEDQRWQRLPY